MSIRFFIVGRNESGRPIDACLCERLSLSRRDVRRMLREQQVRINGAPCADPHRRLQRGQRVQARLPATPPKKDKAAPHRRSPSSPHKGPQPIIRYADEHIVVAEKPAGLTTMRHAEDVAEFGQRARRFLPPTLADMLPELLAQRGGRGRETVPQRGVSVRAVHRLDKDTSGLVVFARTVEAERHLGQQFRAHTIERQYLAVVRGQAKPARIESRLVRDRGDGRRGSSASSEGQLAVTNVHIVEALGDNTLVECRLETGRTHQVRIHLGEAGTPLCGERIYDRPLHGKPLPDGSGIPRVALHAALLGFAHPATGERRRWTSRLPKDMADLVQRLRRANKVKD
jgi:23S rRNA pseudouridine1911/1915/1917 synthase